ncbi:MAG: MBL fold metallo-hydrolase [Halanaerobiaceae bacterium]|nr:MBL fold metallo-hydrolase [Halanaerobiaceae bacterium]
MEYRELGKNIAIIAGYNNTGVIENGANTVLIDSGEGDKTAGHISRLLEERGLTPSVIINAHSHADHCGGNNYLQKKYGLEIISTHKESLFIENPFLESFCFFSGSKPIKEITDRFLLAAPSRVTRVISPGEKIKIADLEISFLTLAGHSPEHIGVVVNDIIFCGDAFYSEHVLKRYKLPFLCDVDNSIRALELLAGTEYELYIPSHGIPTRDIALEVELNLEKMRKIEQDILSILVREKTTEELMEELFAKYMINTMSVQEFFLLRTTVLAYLSSLCSRNVVRNGFKEGILSWKRM